jgi:hypothetical protein
MEELDAMLTEAIHNHRWVLLEGYWNLGKAVVKQKLDIEKVALACRQRPKTVHYSVELYKAYPNLNSLPDGKVVSWYKIMKILPPYEKKRPKKRR